MSQIVESALAQKIGFHPRVGWMPELRKAIEAVAKENHLSTGTAEQNIALQPALLREVAERLTVGESYFFRHRSQLEGASERLAQRVRAGERPIVWSAGCSRGEEAYSLLALLFDTQAASVVDSVQIQGTDINGASILQACNGHYGAWSLRDTSPEVKKRHFEGEKSTGYQVRAHLRNKIRFNSATIQQQLAQFPPCSLELVLFRNVAIYLTRAAIEEILIGIQRALLPGGRLIMAPTDPLPSAKDYPQLQMLSVGVYERLGSDSSKVAEEPRKQASTAGTRVKKRARLPRAKQLLADIEEAVAFADCGRLEVATSRLDSLLIRYPDHPQARLARGQVHLAAQHYEPALRDFHRVRLEGPTGVLARYYGTMCLAALDRTEMAVIELAELEQTLLEISPDASLANGYCQVDLLNAVRSDLQRFK